MIENLVEISVEDLTAESQKMFDEGYRFISTTCVDLGDGNLTLTYHFDKDYEMKNYRVTVTRETEVPSISKVYFCALLVENEMKELFGVNIKDILVDYGGHFLLSDEDMCSPQARQIIIEQRGGK